MKDHQGSTQHSESGAAPRASTRGRRDPWDEAIETAEDLSDLKFRNAPPPRSKKGSKQGRPDADDEALGIKAKAHRAAEHLKAQKTAYLREHGLAGRETGGTRDGSPATDIQSVFGTAETQTKRFTDLPPSASSKVQSTTIPAASASAKAAAGGNTQTDTPVWCRKDAEPVSAERPAGSPDEDQTRVIVTGSRNFANRYAIAKALSNVQSRACGELVIFHGAARGADSLAAKWAEEHGVECNAHPADWNRHGKAAGVIRNQAMLDIADPHLVLAFPAGPKSPGTRHMIESADIAGYPVEIADGLGRTYDYDPDGRRRGNRADRPQQQNLPDSGPEADPDWTAMENADPDDDYIEIDEDAPARISPPRGGRTAEPAVERPSGNAANRTTAAGRETAPNSGTKRPPRGGRRAAQQSERQATVDMSRFSAPAGAPGPSKEPPAAPPVRAADAPTGGLPSTGSRDAKTRTAPTRA